MRLIDADRLIDEFEDTVGSPIVRTRLKLQVQNQPTIDAVEVVRCEYCMNRWSDYYCPEIERDVFKDFFCEKGIRKTDG